jgi:hypothetical protein
VRLAAPIALVIALAACKRDAAPDEGTVSNEPLPPVKKNPDLAPPAPRGQTFQLAVSPPAAAKPGEAAIATIAVTPGAGYQLNPEYPYTELTLAPPAGVTAARAVQSATDAKQNDKQQLSFAVELTAATAGMHRIPGELKFAVCTSDESACLPQTRPVEVAVRVE